MQVARAQGIARMDRQFAPCTGWKPTAKLPMPSAVVTSALLRLPSGAFTLDVEWWKVRTLHGVEAACRVANALGSCDRGSVQAADGRQTGVDAAGADHSCGTPA